ncbi:MAG: hypothetical protein WCG26_10180, partial [Chloroflexales bacterium]
GTFELRVRFKSGSTPDGTVALVRAEISGSNAAPAVSNQLPLTALSTPRARADKRFVSGGVLDLPTVYQVEVCVPNASSGALDMPTLVMTDTLPAGSSFITATDGGTYNAGTHTITWPADSILVSAGESCVTHNVTIMFTAALFNIGDQVRNDVFATATVLDGTVLDLTASDIRLIQPPTPGLGFNKSGPTRAQVDDTVRYNFMQRNTGTTALTDLSVEDQIPAELQVSRIFAAAHNLAATLPLTIEYKTDVITTSWQLLPGAPFTAAACVNVDPLVGTCADTLTLPGGSSEYITALRWTYGAPLPYGWEATGKGNGYEAVVSSAPVNQIIVNQADSRYTFNSQPILDTSTVRTRVVVELPGARPSMDKAVAPAIVYAGDAITYTLTLSNSVVVSETTGLTVTTVLSSPQIVDLLVPELLYVAGSQTVVVTPTGAPAATFELIPNYQGTGRLLLRWSWPNYNLAPGKEFQVQFRARISPFTVAGQIANTAYLAGWSNLPDDILLTNCPSTSTDTYDFDNDGNTQEQICSSSISSVSLTQAAKTASLKLVKGQLDTVWTNDPNTGLTVPGGRADYTLTITNTGTIPVKELVLVDILPWVEASGTISDTGVIRFDQVRGSQWRPFLVTPIIGPSGSTVYYSTQRNPCREPDLGITPDSPGCVPAGWATSPPADITTVQAFKIDFGGLVLSPDEAVTVGVQMRAPYDGIAHEIAWNSFAYRAREVGTNAYLLAAEPPRVGIERHGASSPSDPPAYGNFVWLDQNNNNLQDAGEPGINGARVEFFRDSDGITGPSAGDTFVDETISGPHNNGSPGYYLFSHPGLVPPG